MIVLISLGKTVPALTSFSFKSLKVGIQRYWPTCPCGKGDLKKNPTKQIQSKQKIECFDDDIGKNISKTNKQTNLKPKIEWQARQADLLRACFEKQNISSYQACSA